MSVVISSSLYITSTDTDQPLTHARIGYQKISGTITASSEASGYPASDADFEMTYNYWQPTSMPATWEINAGSAQAVNYFGIAAHTLGTDQVTIAAQGYTGTEWVTLSETLPGDESPIMMLFGEVNYSRYRILISGSTTPRIGVVYIGKALEMQRPIYGGHSPAVLSRTTVTRPVSSERGQWLSRSIIRTGFSGTWSWQNLTAAWYRTYFDPFVEAARTKPFFISWRPLTFPEEVVYAWTESDIRPTNQGTRDLMSVTLNAKGLGVD